MHTYTIYIHINIYKDMDVAFHSLYTLTETDFQQHMTRKKKQIDIRRNPST